MSSRSPEWLAEEVCHTLTIDEAEGNHFARFKARVARAIRRGQVEAWREAASLTENYRFRAAKANEHEDMSEEWLLDLRDELRAKADAIELDQIIRDGTVRVTNLEGGGEIIMATDAAIQAAKDAIERHRTGGKMTACECCWSDRGLGETGYYDALRRHEQTGCPCTQNTEEGRKRSAGPYWDAEKKIDSRKADAIEKEIK